MAFILTPDESVIGRGGKVLFFSINRFIKDICEGNCCFICGAAQNGTAFNNEHVLPKWVLRKYNLYNQSITLPNGTTFEYGQYTIPCCKSCNDLMGRTFEEPIRELITQGYEAVVQYVEDNGPWLFFNWLCLIYLKTFLKHKTLRWHKDRRNGDEKLSDFHTWEGFHHIHCVARSFYTGCEIDSKVRGSFFLLPAQKFIEEFDYVDLYESRTVLLRLGDLAFVSVLNDSRAVSTLLEAYCWKITGPMSPLQLGEFMAICAYGDLRLKKRPRFYSEIDTIQNLYRITADLPDEFDLGEYDPSEYGKLMYFCCQGILSNIQNEDKEQTIEHVKQGLLTFILDEHDNFRTDSLEFSGEEGSQR